MGSSVLRGILTIENFIKNISTNNLFFSGFTLGGILSIVALILGYALVVQAAVFVVVGLAAIVSERFNSLKNMKESTERARNGENENIAEKSNYEKNVDKNQRIKIGSTYWTL